MTASNLALLFPGQGCQFVGMGAELCQSYGEAKEVFDAADDILGYALSSICFEGPEDALNDTANTQPAIYVASYALWRVLQPRLEPVRERITCSAGNSLGEYAALAAAGAMRFEDGLRLVRRRGEAMRQAGIQSPGAMTAIIGLDDAAVSDIVAQAGDGVWIANYNAPGQVVIAGELEPLARANELAQAAKARRVVPLSVSVACHTPLMAQASRELAEALEDVEFSTPWMGVVANAEARPLYEAPAIKSALLKQLSSPVRWVESIQHMVDTGVTAAIEVGPKAIVSALVRRIHRPMALHAVTDSESLQKLDVEAL